MQTERICNCGVKESEHKNIRHPFISNKNNIEDRELAIFLRWLLKHYSTEIVYNGMFTYVDSLGREVDIEQIIEHYKSEN